MDLLLFRMLAILLPLLHLGFILWVIFGALLTRGRRILTGLHLGTLAYGFLIEILPVGCPLTSAEQWARQGAGMAPYPGDFLTHYLELIIYPDVSYGWLIVGAAAVCAVNLAVYVRRWGSQRKQKRRG